MSSYLRFYIIQNASKAQNKWNKDEFANSTLKETEFVPFPKTFGHTIVKDKSRNFSVHVQLETLMLNFP